MNEVKRYTDSNAMLDSNAESITELKEKFHRLEGGRALVRSRSYFVVRIDKFVFTDTGFEYSGQLLRPIQSIMNCASDSRDFRWSYTWDWLTGGHGVVHAPYVSWSLYYDQSLISSVLHTLDSNPTADIQALRLIEDWEAVRDAERTKYFDSQKSGRSERLT